MKCKNCGEFCNENQVFCLKCGTPVYQDNSSEQSTNNLLKGEEGDRLVEEEEDNMPQKVEVELSVQDMEQWNRQQAGNAEKKESNAGKEKKGRDAAGSIASSAARGAKEKRKESS